MEQIALLIKQLRRSSSIWGLFILFVVEITEPSQSVLNWNKLFMFIDNVRMKNQSYRPLFN